MIRMMTELETNIVSVERVDEYCHVSQEVRQRYHHGVSTRRESRMLHWFIRVERVDESWQMKIVRRHDKNIQMRINLQYKHMV